jgi:hypothetical protein
MKERLIKGWSRIKRAAMPVREVPQIASVAASPGIALISLGVPVAGADLVLGTTTLEPLSGLDDDCVALIRIDDFALNEIDIDELFTTLHRVIAPGGLMRLGFGCYHLGVGGGTDDEIATAVSSFMMRVAKAGFVVEVLQQSQHDIFVPAYAEKGGRLNRSRKWTLDSESFKATTLLHLTPAVLEIDFPNGERRLVKRRDHGRLRNALREMMDLRPALPAAAPLLEALAGSHHAFDDVSAAAFIETYAFQLLNSGPEIDLLNLLLQTVLRSDFCSSPTWWAVNAFMRGHQDKLQSSPRFLNLAATVLQRIGGTQPSDHWASLVYQVPSRRTYEAAFNGHVMGALSKITGKRAPANDTLPFDVEHEIYAAGIGRLGRFGNQLTQFAYMTCAAAQLGLHVRTPRWIGSYLFEGQERAALAEQPAIDVVADKALRTALLSRERSAIAGRGVTGFFNFSFVEVAATRDVFRTAGRIDPKIIEQLAELEPDVLGGRPFIGVHVRRGDFGYSRFRKTPEHVFERRVADPAFQNLPILMVTDATPGELQFSDAFKERLVARPVYDNDVLQLVADWIILSRCSVLMHANSTFSFSAALMSRSDAVFRPNPDYSSLEPYDPWASLPFFG